MKANKYMKNSII